MKKNATNNDKKSVKNYILFVLMVLGCIVVILYLCKIYKVNDAEKKKIPVIDGMLSQIYSDDLEHYIMDNPTAYIYICTANDETCRNFERSFKKLLKSKDYSNYLIYLNVTDLNQKDFVDSFNEKYQYKKRLKENYPAFVLFEDGKIRKILQGKNDEELTITRVKQFLELNDVGE